jgi:hypothetical protein
MRNAAPNASRARDSCRPPPDAPRALSRPNQLRWGMAFFPLLAATLLAAYGASSLLNAAALAPSALSRAAQTLSLRWPAAPMPPATARRSGVLVSAQASEPLELALRWGVWRGAATFGKIPSACLTAMAGTVEPLVDAPAMAMVPLVWGGGSGGGGEARGWDPRGATWLRGWLRVGSGAGGALGLTLPTDAGLAKAVVIVFSGFMLSVVVLLFGVDIWHSECRPYLLRRRARARKAAMEARQREAGQRAELARGGAE